MTNQTSEIKPESPLHLFDGKLGALQGLLLEMTELLMYQLEQTLHALDYADADLALRVIARDRKVDDYQARIENEVHLLLDASLTLPSDLRTLMIVSKMAGTLEKIGNEVADFARLSESLLACHGAADNAELLTDIIKIGRMIKIMLDKMAVVQETRYSNQAYKLMRYGWNCDTLLQQSLEHQLVIMTRSSSGIDHSLDALRILKALERCAGLSRHIAEYQILMLDSVDMRRLSTPDNAPSRHDYAHEHRASFAPGKAFQLRQ